MCILLLDRLYVHCHVKSIIFPPQDFPQRSSTTSANVQRERRRRHYYAREDSDEEEAELSSVQRDDTEGT